MAEFAPWVDLLPELRRFVSQLAGDDDARSLAHTCHWEWENRDRTRKLIPETVRNVHVCSDFAPLYHDMDVCWTTWTKLMSLPFRMWVLPRGLTADELYIVTVMVGTFFVDEIMVTIRCVLNPWNVENMRFGQEDDVLLEDCTFVREGSPYWRSLVELARTRRHSLK
jgi:hypothetical protein